MKISTVALQVTDTDYTRWRPIFDQYRSTRAHAGFKNGRVFETWDDPNEVNIWEATSSSKLRRALASSELKTAMKKAGGVDGTLKLHVIPFNSDAVIA